MARVWGVKTVGGRSVVVEIADRLCTLCRRAEYITHEDGQFTRMTYFDQTPVWHKR